MSDPSITIVLLGNGRAYRPGDALDFEYRVDGLHTRRIKAVEVSVLWYTEGKGDEDLAVHEFRRLDVAGDYAIDLAEPQQFSTTLPNSPLSYDGSIVKLRWCVRVRAFLHHGKELVGQRGFRLGNVHAPKGP